MATGRTISHLLGEFEMNITQNQVKNLSRMLSKKTGEPYMKCLDAISETLSGLRWNILKVSFDKEEQYKLPASELSSIPVKGFEDTKILSCDNGTHGVLYGFSCLPDDSIEEPPFYKSDNITDISILSDVEKEILASLGDLVPTEGLMRYLFCRPAPRQLDGDAVTRFEVFSPPLHVTNRDPKVRMALFRRFPLLINILAEWFFREWKKHPRKAYDIMPDFLPCATEESSRACIMSSLNLFGYDQESIKLLSSYELASALSKLKLPLDIPPPIFLNGGKITVDDILSGLKRQEVSIFALPSEIYCPILIFIEDDTGVNCIRDWTNIYHAIRALSYMTQFSTKTGGYISSDTFGWSIVNIFQPGQYKYCLWERYRGFKGTTKPEISPIAQRYFMFQNIEDLCDAGMRVAQNIRHIKFPSSFYITSDNFPDIIRSCPQILQRQANRKDLIASGTNSDVYRDMKKLASIEFTGVAFPIR